MSLLFIALLLLFLGLLSILMIKYLAMGIFRIFKLDLTFVVSIMVLIVGPVLPLEISELDRVSSGWTTSPSLSKFGGS